MILLLEVKWRTGRRANVSCKRKKELGLLLLLLMVVVVLVVVVVVVGKSAR